MLRSAVLTAVVAAALPATASAATVRMGTTSFHAGKGGVVTRPVVHVAAAPGEVNDIALALQVEGRYANSHGVVVVSDATATLVPGNGCSVSGNAVSCPVDTPFVYADVDLSNGDDRLTVRDAFDKVDARGGPGADHLYAGPASRASLDGGAGDDALAGGPGADMLVGGPGADAISGGAGYDAVSYAERMTGVTVRLGGSGLSGAPGEGDTIAPDVEGAYGGAGDDVLIGSPGPDHLTGNAGNDRVEGLGGNDELRGDQGTGFVAPDADVVLGGGGNDSIATVGNGTRVDGGTGEDEVTTIGPVAIDPGPGRDFVRALGGGATVAAETSDAAVDLVRCVNGAARSVRLGDGDFSDGCGRAVRQTHLRPFALLADDPWTWAHPSLTTGLDLACADATRRGCAVRLSLRNVDTGRVLAAERVRLTAGARVPLALTLPPQGVRQRDRFVDYVVSMRAPSGEVHVLRWHAWIPGGSNAPTDGAGGRDAPVPPRINP